MKKRLLPVLIAAIMLVAIYGCNKPQVNYTDATAVDTVTTDFSSTDLQTISQNMLESLLSSPVITKAANKNGGTLIVCVGDVKNNTDQHIQTTMLTNAISTKMLNSGLFQLVDMKVMKKVKSQLKFQTKSGMVDPAKAVEVGRMTGAQYMLYGDISNISQRNSDGGSVFYQMTLSMVDLKSGLIVWRNIKQIRKTANRAALGM